MSRSFKNILLTDKMRDKIIRSFSDQAIAKGKEAEIKENEEIDNSTLPTQSKPVQELLHLP